MKRLFLFIVFTSISITTKGFSNPGSNLKQEIDSGSDTITLPFDANYSYSSSVLIDGYEIDGVNKILVIELDGNSFPTIDFSNFTFKNFKEIRFEIHKAAILNIDNVTFEDIESVNFLYGSKSELYTGSYVTQLNITRSTFDFDDVVQTMSDFGIKFSKIGSISDWTQVAIDNVLFKENTFSINSSNNPGGTPNRFAIFFKRANSKVNIKNIQIHDNIFTLTSDNYKVWGVSFDNFGSDTYTPGSNFDFLSSPNYSENKNIEILRNKFVGESINPGSGIFIQGPYDAIQIKDNIITGFGLYGTGDPFDGAVELYGARTLSYTGTNNKYSHNLRNVTVKNNHIETVSTGIRSSGSEGLNIENNSILMLDVVEGSGPETGTRKAISTGGGRFDEAGYQSKNIIIKNNFINLNSQAYALGIRVGASKNFTIEYNEIEKATSFGIIYYSQTDWLDQDVGISKIKYNTIDYDNTSSLSNYIFPYSTNSTKPTYKFAAIAFGRKSSQSNPENETLTISDNIIENTGNFPSSALFEVDRVYEYDNRNIENYSEINNSVINQTQLAIEPKQIVVGDFDGDGIDEFCFRTALNEFFVVEKTGSSTFDVQHWSPISIFWGDSNYESELRAGDFNGDGKDDLYFLNKGNDNYFRLRVALSNGRTFNQSTGIDFVNPNYGFQSYSYLNFDVSDMNRDGLEDVVLRRPDDKYYVFINGGSIIVNGNWSSTPSSPNVGGDATHKPILRLGDFDNDGDNDIYILRKQNSGQYILRVLKNNITTSQTNKSFTGYTGYAQSTMDSYFNNQQYLGFDVADFDGDGDGDVAIRKSNDYYYVIRSNTSYLYTLGTWKSAGIMWGDSTHPTQVFAGNADSDSNEREDLFVLGHSNSGIFRFRAAKSNTSNTFSLISGYNLDHNPSLTSVQHFKSRDDTDVDTEDQHSFKLLPNYPNPFNPTTNISYVIKEKDLVSLKVFNISGQRVATLVSEIKNAGSYTVSFNAEYLSSGIYIYELRVGNSVLRQKMTLIK